MATKTNFYPSGILKEEYKYKHIQLFVKNQGSLSSGASELLSQVQKTANNIKDLFTSKKDQPTDIEDITKINSKTKKLSNLSTVYGVALPLPNELTESQSHQWEQTSGISGDIAEKAAGISFKGINVMKALGEVSSGGGARKPLIDPGYFQDYKGSEPREFSFSWDLIPGNKSEADNIIAILYNLKKFTLPTATINGMSLLSPYLFELKIGNPLINSIMNMNNVVCKSMDINYSAVEGLQFFEDGMPKYMKLDMSFAERSSVTSDFY